MNDGELLGGVGVGIALRRRAMRCPACVPDADVTFQWLGTQPLVEVDKFALGAPPGQHPALKRCDAGRIVAAIFKPLQRIDEERSNRLKADNPNNPAHTNPLAERAGR